VDIQVCVNEDRSELRTARFEPAYLAKLPTKGPANCQPVGLGH
jgi:hypothetical protein